MVFCFIFRHDYQIYVYMHTLLPSPRQPQWVAVDNVIASAV